MFVTHYPQAWLALIDSLIRILTFAQFCPNLERKYMCWFINKTEFEDNPNQYHKVAEEDIFVYKIGDVINGKFFPYFKCDFATF